MLKIVGIQPQKVYVYDGGDNLLHTFPANTFVKSKKGQTITHVLTDLSSLPAKLKIGMSSDNGLDLVSVKINEAIYDKENKNGPRIQVGGDGSNIIKTVLTKQ